jgi:hypothetical protein
MTLARPMTVTERAALADAIRDMRLVGIMPIDLIHSGAPKRPVRNTPLIALRSRLAPKAVRS